MTLVIATTHGVWADRKITASSGETCDPVKKVAVNDHLCAGFAGAIELILYSVKSVASGADDPKDLALSGVEGLVVREGRIYLLDLKKAWLRPKRCAFYCVGTGGTTAMAFLSGRGSLTPKDIKDTFRYVSKARDDCSATFDHVSV
jgi:hypothetical protein